MAERGESSEGGHDGRVWRSLAESAATYGGAMSDVPAVTVTVSDSPDENRYEARLDGAVAGFARYVRRGGRTFFVHTEVDPSFEGRGIGSALVRDALAAERAAGTPIVPLCPFVRGYIDKHPEYADLVDTDLLNAIDNG
jgi:predicted GNAT family acetyltransferase